MRIFDPATPNQFDLGRLILRIVAGVIFAAHGGQKLFVYGFDGVAGAFAQMGVPLPGLTGPLVAFLEFGGGIALILGVLSRLAALGLAVNMLAAIFLVHIGAGFFLPDGMEFVLALFGIAAAVTVMGPGGYSVDAIIAGRRGIRPARMEGSAGSARRAA